MRLFAATAQSSERLNGFKFYRISRRFHDMACNGASIDLPNERERESIRLSVHEPLLVMQLMVSELEGASGPPLGR